MNRQLSATTILIFTIILVACVSGNERFTGKIIRIEQIRGIPSESGSNTLNTSDLSMNYNLIKKTSEKLSINGHVRIKTHITNSYPVIKNFNLMVFFVSSDGVVISSTIICPLFSVGNNTPEKLPFSSILSLPVNAEGLCFSYTGKFKTAGRENEFLMIERNSFQD